MFNREEYEKQLAKEKLELLKKKQGSFDENKADETKDEPSKKKYTKKEKIENFFYHYKIHVIVGAILAAFVGFLAHDFFSRVNPDVAIIFMAKDGNFPLYTETAEKLFEQYCADFNGDGKVYVRVSYLPVVGDEGMAAFYYNQADQLKLMAEFQMVDSIIIIADEEAIIAALIDEEVLKDLHELELYDDQNVNEFGYLLSATNFKADINYPDLADDLYVCFREPIDVKGLNFEKFTDNFNNALTMWNNYITNNKIN